MEQSRFARALPRFLAAGGLLALLELGLVLCTERELFLGNRELLRYASFALCALPVLAALVGMIGLGVLGLLARGVEPFGQGHAARAKLAVAVAAWPLLALLASELSGGRHLRALPGRGLAAVALGGVAAWLLGVVLAGVLRASASTERRAQLRLGLLFALIAVVALVVDMYVLRRLYVTMHMTLAAGSLASAVLASSLWPEPRPALDLPRLQRGLPTITLIALGAALLLGLDLRRAPNARFAVVQAAPLSGKLLPLISPRPPASTAVAAPSAPKAPSAVAAAPAHAGVDLRGQDVLLITIDALRADCLAPYGGTGLTPQLDALARESAVFERVYTPTPHTSYAVTSLMTGKFMQPLLALAGDGHPSGEHPTLPELLRRNGYRTAAFYPPAIFFVDQERFTEFESRKLGFEYVKAQFAPVDRQVGLLQHYLDHAETGYPLFVWVHVFEPHEPYEPPPAFARGNSPRERYDGEVAAADDGAGKLIAAFRRARPGATVIVSADHGEEHGEHGGHHHGTTLFDEQIRIPLLWSSPGRVSPHVISAPAELLDITTTLLSALGIPREARMRGDDLSPLLAGTAASPAPAADPQHDAPRYAFSMIDGARMIMDGQRKLICGARDCQLFDLATDPHERRDLIDEQPQQVTSLRAALDDFLASLPRIEALALDGGAWPEALTRARLGDASAAPELVPLLSSPRSEVRAAAARMLGELAAANARTVLSGLRTHDPDPAVRAEAALAALRLDERDAQPQVAALLADPAGMGVAPALRGGAPAAGVAPALRGGAPAGGVAPALRGGAPVDRELVRRAALALAEIDDRSGEPVLSAMAADDSIDEPQRVGALRALARVGGKASLAALAALLPSVRLRPEVARTLGAIGDRHAVPALLAALQKERYPEGRTPEARALYTLGAKRQANALVRRFLGTESSLADGVAMLLENGALTPASGAGADLRAPSALQRGPWQCSEHGCQPQAGASIALPARGAPQGSARVVLRVHVEGAAQQLRIGDSPEALDGGNRELARGLAQARNLVLPVAASAGVWLQAIAVVPVTEDVPSPPPEPWQAADGGVDGGVQ